MNDDAFAAVWNVINPNREISINGDDVPDPTSILFKAAALTGAPDPQNIELVKALESNSVAQPVERPASTQPVRDLSNAASGPGMVRFFQVGDVAIGYDCDGVEVCSRVL